MAFAKSVRVEPTIPRTIVEPNRMPSVNWMESERLGIRLRWGEIDMVSLPGRFTKKLHNRAGLRHGIYAATVLFLLSMLAQQSAAQAGTATANLTVQMTITASCTINAATLTFPSTPGTNLLTTAVTGSTTVSVTCTSGSPYSIGMNNGVNVSGTQRRMANGANFLNYGLYVDAAFANPWTTGSANNACTTTNDCYLGTGSGSAQSVNIYGQVPTTATAPVTGTYTDTVTMTITY
jgi:spore coat protein U-like protein